MATVKHNETQLVKACLSYLECRLMAWRQNTGAMGGVHKGKKWYVRFGRPGMSDIAGILPDGRALYIECKMPGKHPTKLQRQFLEDVKATNGVGFVVHSLDELADQMRGVASRMSDA